MHNNEQRNCSSNKQSSCRTIGSSAVADRGRGFTERLGSSFKSSDRCFHRFPDWTTLWSARGRWTDPPPVRKEGSGGNERLKRAGFAVEPCAFHKGGVGNFRHTELVVLELAGEDFHGNGPDDAVVLAHAGCLAFELF